MDTYKVPGALAVGVRLCLAKAIGARMSENDGYVHKFVSKRYSATVSPNEGLK